ncbi:hypothetical protein [Rhodovulum steppense]|uniref:Uncharacterized protein n=1 Tax=Rhodovulum steppense TaxID=540251 RepID=A0A4R1YLQ6_9RHOB|nr:hypothetical protein [Rhodovulum steppense]TCM78376.1 hypothetical protein EV216_12653 [Rhodovulum steppense]
MKTAFRISALACAMALAAPAFAEENTPVDPAQIDPVTRMNNAVFELAIERVEKLLKPGDILRLMLVAQQKGLAINCAGYEVDDKRFGAVMQDIVKDITALTEQGQENLAFDIVIGSYQMALGGQMAVAAYDPAAYCAHGEELRTELAEDTEGRVWVLAPAQ